MVVIHSLFTGKTQPNGRRCGECSVPGRRREAFHAVAESLDGCGPMIRTPPDEMPTEAITIVPRKVGLLGRVGQGWPRSRWVNGLLGLCLVAAVVLAFLVVGSSSSPN